MFKINRRSVLKTTAAAMAVGGLPSVSRAQSAFTPPFYTPEDLKGQLTPFGAIKAGNADGTIPAWAGGGCPMPSGYQQGDVRPIPFADEQPLFTITASNMSQYSNKISIGLQGIFQKYPDFTMEVFPTHRTAIAPQYVYDYMYENATNAQLSADGNSVSNAYGGLPFPIPQNGHEVMWNHLVSWNGVSVYSVSVAYVVTASGQLVFESRVNSYVQFPYYMPNGKDNWDGLYSQEFIFPVAPPYEAGGSIVKLQPVDLTKVDVSAWEYLVGQRRVRRAPELQYDTPNSIAGGVSNWDETFMFEGMLVEYNFTYTGIKEMYVPYNANKILQASPTDQYKSHFLNPELVRWELHRVRVVEMTLKPGARNVDARRTMYFDEDTGSAVLGEIYDGSGALWKVMHNLPGIFGDVPAIVTAGSFIIYDLHAGTYFGGAMFDSSCTPNWKTIAPLPDTFFSPGHLAAASVGY